MISTEEILAKLGLDTTAFHEALHGVKDRVKDFFKDFAVNPITQFFAVEKVAESIRGTIEWGNQLRKLAEEADVSTDFIQGLEAASHKLGLSAENTSAALTKFAIKVGEARNSKDQLLAGIDVEGKTTEQVFFEIADKMHNTANGAERAALAIEIAGKNGKDLGLALAQGGDNLRSIMEEAHKLT